MQFHRFGDDADPTVLFILGWGNRVAHPNVSWFIDRIVEAGFAVHAAEIPDNGTDFERDYVDPVTAHARSLEAFRLLSHSTGGLVAAHLPADGPRIYLSPFWGVNTADVSPTLFRVLTALPTDRQFIGSDIDADALGALKDPEVVAESNLRASPAWLRTMRDAQSRLPPFREGSRVFCCLHDQVVDVRAIGHHAPADAITLYDGGHELFSVERREEYVHAVVAALRPRSGGAF